MPTPQKSGRSNDASGGNISEKISRLSQYAQPP